MPTNISKISATGEHTHKYLSKTRSFSSRAPAIENCDPRIDRSRPSLVLHTTHLLRCPPAPPPPPGGAPRCPPLSIRRYITRQSHESQHCHAQPLKREQRLLLRSTYTAAASLCVCVWKIALPSVIDPHTASSRYTFAKGETQNVFRFSPPQWSTVLSPGTADLLLGTAIARTTTRAERGVCKDTRNKLSGVDLSEW